MLFFFVLFLRQRPGWLRTHYADQAGLEFTEVSLSLCLPSAELEGVCHHISFVPQFKSQTWLDVVDLCDFETHR